MNKIKNHHVPSIRKIDKKKKKKNQRLHRILTSQADTHRFLIVQTCWLLCLTFLSQFFLQEPANLNRNEKLTPKKIFIFYFQLRSSH